MPSATLGIGSLAIKQPHNHKDEAASTIILYATPSGRIKLKADRGVGVYCLPGSRGLLEVL